MTIRSRINALFFLAAALAIGAGLGAMWAMAGLEGALAAMDSHHRRQLLGETLRANTAEASSHLTAFMAAGDESARDRFEASRRRVDETLRELRAASGSDESTAASSLVEETIARYSRAADQVMFVAKRSTDGRAFRWARDFITDRHYPNMDRAVAELVAFHREASARAEQAAVERSRRTGALLQAAFVLLVVLVAATLLLVRRWLVEPVESLVSATRRISTGELRGKVPVERDDELGQLAREIESMGRSIETIQQQLVEKERLAAVGEMTSAVAHNVRNPLASIRALAQGLLRSADSNGKASDTDLEMIMQTVDKADRWLKDLLIAHRPVRVERAPQDVNRVLRDLAGASEDFARRRSVCIELDLSENLPELPIDQRRIDQALASLISNAVDASSPGDVVTLRSRWNPKQRDHVEIIIEDSGKGLTAEEKQKMFLPYYSTKKSGTGLGLSLTQRIILGHQGSIVADSEPGDGCRMRVSLPLNPPTEVEDDGSDSDPR